jgi:hypothetical protein
LEVSEVIEKLQWVQAVNVSLHAAFVQLLEPQAQSKVPQNTLGAAVQRFSGIHFTSGSYRAACEGSTRRFIETLVRTVHALLGVKDRMVAGHDHVTAEDDLKSLTEQQANTGGGAKPLKLYVKGGGSGHGALLALAVFSAAVVIVFE